MGFHTLMALVPAFLMAEQEADPAKKPLAVLKVLHRNANRLKEFGNSKETLKVVKPGKLEGAGPGGEQLRDAARKGDMTAAEAAFAAICNKGNPADALHQLMLEVDDATEVHRVVLVSRAWDLTHFVGTERAHTMLRQSVHYCVKAERNANQAKYNASLRTQLPKLLDQYKLLSRKPGSRSADDGWVEKFANTIFKGTPEQAADAVAAALAEGFSAEDIGQALALGANQLLLRDEGRPKAWASPGKPVGSVHGDSVGLHCCDTIHAWRNLARCGDRRTQVTSLILAGYEVARDRGHRPEFTKWEPYPRAEHRDKVKGIPADTLLKELDAAIQDKDQPRAAARHRPHWNRETRQPTREVFALFRGYAVSQDGGSSTRRNTSPQSPTSSPRRAPPSSGGN